MAKLVENWDAECIAPQDGKIVVVTGANAGIGLCTATALARKHAHVILACRNEARGLQAQQDIRQVSGNDQVEFMQLDLGALESIRTFSQQFHAKFDHLDLLFDNAGVFNTPSDVTSDGFETRFGVNYVGHFYLTSLLFDLLKASKAARIIGLSSLAHYYRSADFSTYGYPMHESLLRTYSVSKLAMAVFMFELDRRLRAAGIHNVKAIAVHPGMSMTTIMKIPRWLHKLLWTFSFCLFQSSIDMAALPSLMAATEESIESGEFIGPSKVFGMRGAPKREVPSRQSRSEEYGAKLWKRSEELIHAEFVVE